MRIKKGRLRLSPNEEAAILKEETERRRKIRLQQVREQSKENAAKIRTAVKQEKHRQLMKLATEIKNQLEAEKAERVRHLEQQYENSLRNIGAGHKQAALQPDWTEERELVQEAANLRADVRGRRALEKLNQETAYHNHEAHKHIIARKQALEVERQRAAEIASMPPPPPDPLIALNINKPKPVKVTDMNAFSTTHYHLQNEHAVDRAGPEEQMDARAAAELEADRIKERALEMKSLREDQLERARLRHNAALEKELLKHDYNNILHDLSDLQRADRERRLRIVHNIPKQVFEPPNVRMEDREEKQRNLEEEFENMYMAGTHNYGDISFALDPQPRPLTPNQEGSLDITATDGTPLQEPTLPNVPPVLRDMTNMPKPKSPGKKPEKVLRNLMDRIKSQREDWMTSQSNADIGESTLHNGYHQQPESSDVNAGQFHQMIPDQSPVVMQEELSHIPAKQARVASPVQSVPASVTQQHQYQQQVQQRQMQHPSQQQQSVLSRKTAMAPDEFAEKLRNANQRQQTNVQIRPAPAQTTVIPSDLQQLELAEVLKQQEIILEQKRQLELKLQQLTYEKQKMELDAKAASQQPVPTQPQMPAPGSNLLPMSVQQVQHSIAGSIPIQQYSMNQSVPVAQQNGFHPAPQAQGQGQILSAPQQPLPGAVPGVPQQQFASSLSSSGMSQRPMNSIPPTHTTGSAPAYAGHHGYQGHVHGYQGQTTRSAYQPQSAVLTTDQLAMPSGHPAYPQVGSQFIYQNGIPASSATQMSGTQMTNAVQGHAVSPGHLPPASLTNEGMSEQMKKVRAYQEHLLARHEQSKKVLDETKAEIKRRRENLLERYPNLDLSRLEELGAKHLDHQPTVSTSVSQEVSSAQARDQGQGHSVSVSSLLASLAAHPYYAATLSRPDSQQPITTSVGMVTSETAQVGNLAQRLDIDSDINLRKNKLENIRKSLPFDADETIQTPVRVYEAYAEKTLDTTSATDITESDTSTLTEKGSPALRPAPIPAPRTSHHASVAQKQVPPPQQLRVEQKGMITSQADTTNTDTDIDTTASASMLSDLEEVMDFRQDQLREQLLEIQRQKEEIIRRHQQGQQKLQDKEEEIKTKLTILKPDIVIRETLIQNEQSGRQLQLNLSTIQEVDTPASTRPSDSGTSDGETISQRSKKSLEFSQRKTETIPEVSEQNRLENVETQMQKTKAKSGPVGADYSGKNIEDVLERAKRFEAEVLQKLRKQTNAVLFDNEFDDSLEFNVSRQQNSALSSGSLTPSSMSTGPLDDTTQSQSKLTDTRSANGSFQTSSKTWADVLSENKMPASNQSELSFKVVSAASKPVQNNVAREVNQSTEKPKSQKTEGTMFADGKNRFKVYSEINSNDTSKSDGSSLDNSKLDSTADSFEPDSMNAGAMLEHLKSLQEQLRKGEEERMLLAQKLAEQQANKTSEQSKDSLSQYSLNSTRNDSKPEAELSQHSFTDKSADVSLANDKPRGRQIDSPVQSGTSSREKMLPVRRSPIGDHARAEPKSGLTNGSGAQDVTSTEYSFTVADSREQRSTSTPGEDRRKSALDGTSRTELPSEITVGRPSDTGSTKFGVSGTPSDLSSYTVRSSLSGNTREFRSMTPTMETSNERSNQMTGISSEFRSMTPNMDSSKEMSKARSGMSAEKSLESIKKEFEKFGKPVAKVKTFAVNRDGDLIPDQSDSDKSNRNNDTTRTELSQYTLSTQSSSKFDSLSALSEYSLPETSTSKNPPQVSVTSNRSSFTSISTDTNPKSSSFTNVTSEQSLNATGASGLSQYTLNDTNGDKSETEKNENDNNYVHQKFASLDNLISESKTIIARHKEIISKNKATEDNVPKTRSNVSSSTARTTDWFKNETKPTVRANDSSMKETTVSSDLSKNTSGTQSGNQSGTQSSNVNESSLDYLIEHSSGITDEPLPDLTTMTLGSELSISEAYNKDDEENDDQDSLKSFEKHELSESESMSTSLHDDSTHDNSKSASLEQIIEARKHNFMIQSEKRAEAAKERALAKFSSRASDDDQTFRAVPVSVVAEPTLSMSVNVSGPDRGKSPTPLLTKGTKSGTDSKSNFEPKESVEFKSSFLSKERERKTSTSSSSKPLNRALQPRSGESLGAKDSGSRPRDSGTKPKGSSYLSKFASSKFSSNETSTENRGRLAGEIRQFGGSAGFSSPPTPKKTPPKVAPKPVRSKSVEPPSSKPVTSGLSKTLSSWKKSRAVSASAKLPEPREEESLQNSVRVLPKEAPPILTEEERRKRAEDELYEKNIRAYNPRLFRLQFKLDRDDTAQDTPSPPPSDRSSRDSKKPSLIPVKKK